MTHNFDTSLQAERAQATTADTFYRQVLHVSSIRRFSSDSHSDMEMQRQDVDALITIGEVTYRISEKFRAKDYGDLYVEMFSKFPNVPGWIATGSPNAILYFTPCSVYWITHKSLSDFCKATLFPLIHLNWLQDLYVSNKNIVSKTIVLDGQTVKLNLIKAHNHPSEGRDWVTIGLSAPFGIFEKCGVKIRKYPLYPEK
jgi:hypothetical protein